MAIKTPVAPIAPVEPVAPEMEQTAFDAKLDAALSSLKSAITSLVATEADALNDGITAIIVIYSINPAKLAEVKIPAKLAGKTSGKVLDYVLNNTAKAVIVRDKIADSMTNKTATSTQINARFIAVLKAYFTVKPFIALI